MIDLADLCEALADDLEGHAWTDTPDVVSWDYDVDEELPAITVDTLRVTVVPSMEEPNIESRGGDSADMTVTVFVQKKPKTLSKAAVKPVMRLAREISTYYLGSGLVVGTRTVHCLAAKVVAPIHHRHYRELRQATWAVQLTWTVYE